MYELSTFYLYQNTTNSPIVIITIGYKMHVRGFLLPPLSPPHLSYH